MNFRFKILVITIICIGLNTIVVAQLDTSALWVNIDSIYISSTRLDNSWLNASQALTDKNYNDETRIEQDLSPIHLFDNIPGVFIMNANNYAQDIRLSLRGFGARSSFGIRGVKFIVDGIPQSTPDGQTQLDDLPIGFIKNIEVIRGSASSLYGNASGGVISLNTMGTSNTNLLAKPYLSVSSSFGSFNSLGVQLMGAIMKNKSAYTFYASNNSSDGYREHSAFVNRVLKLGFDHRFSKYAQIKVNLQYLDSPKAEDSGALSLLELDSSRVQARPRNLAFKTGESVNQLRSSIKYIYQASDNNLFELYGFYTKRNFENFLPFETQGNINLDRRFYGQGTSYTVTRNQNGHKIEFKYGYDVGIQKDNRLIYSNLAGEQGPLDESLEASFKNVGLFIINQSRFNNLTLNAGIRFDHNGIRIQDNFELNNDISGQVDYSAWNPSLGVCYNLDSQISIYANYSSSFETPTLNELSNNPMSIIGLNKFLEPQKAKNIEFGVKFTNVDRLRLDLSLFNVNTSNDLVPYQLAAWPGKTFFRNIGSTKRSGIEISAFYNILKGLSTNLSYTLSSFKYESYEVNDLDFSGNVLPGIPNHFTSVKFSYQHELGINLSLDNQYVSFIYTADDNFESSPSYLLSNLRISYDQEIASYRVMPFLGINNLLNATYNDNVRINAFSNAYYEAAPGINYFGGIKVLL